eukprot:scaffold24748_cov30-Phaeocystis_antarctica.AAC.1
MDTQDMHPDPCSRAGLSRARYAGVARTRGAAKSQLGHRIRRRCEGERGTGGGSGQWRCRRSRGRLLGRHQWRVWRHGARGSAHEQSTRPLAGLSKVAPRGRGARDGQLMPQQLKR